METLSLAMSQACSSSRHISCVRIFRSPMHKKLKTNNPIKAELLLKSELRVFFVELVIFRTAVIHLLYIRIIRKTIGRLCTKCYNDFKNKKIKFG